MFLKLFINAYPHSLNIFLIKLQYQLELLQNIEIDRLKRDEIPKLRILQPQGWNDITKVFLKFIDIQEFIALKAIYKDTMIGVGQLMIHKSSAWLGNIITHRDFRNEGIGSFLTQELLRICEIKRVESIMLLATDMGASLYERIGFKEISRYKFFQSDAEKDIRLKIEPISLRSIKKSDIRSVLDLDRQAYGEDRSSFLSKFMLEGFILEDPENDKTAYYFPGLGDGLIVSNDPNLGIKLMKQHIAKGNHRFAVPTENEVAIQFLTRNRFNYYRKATFMIKGKVIERKPGYIFGRIGGYLG